MKKKHWNYRLCKHKLENGYEQFDIREIYYLENGDIDLYSTEPLVISHIPDKEDTEEDIINSLKFDLKKSLEALKKPVVDLDSLFKSNNKEASN